MKASALVFVPVVKWTHYGRWTEDGKRVLGSHGQIIYHSAEDAQRIQLERAELLIKRSLAIRDARQARASWKPEIPTL